MQKLPTHLDARGMRGILSRGPAKYGVSGAPKPGNLKRVQAEAKRRMKRMQSGQSSSSQSR